MKTNDRLISKNVSGIRNFSEILRYVSIEKTNRSLEKLLRIMQFQHAEELSSKAYAENFEYLLLVGIEEFLHIQNSGSNKRHTYKNSEARDGGDY